MKLKYIAAAAASALALSFLPWLSACSGETAIKYTLFSSDGEVIRTDSFAADPYSDELASSAESASEGSYYVVTGYSGQPAEVVIPAEINGVPVQGIASQAFGNCNYLQSVVIEEGVSYVGQAAFVFCSYLSKAELPSTLDVADSMFGGCELLESVTLAEGITSIGNMAFSGCTSLASINADGENSLNLPSTLTSIGAYAFYDCNALKGELEIPEGVSTISNYSFSRCYEITSVSMGSSVTEIGFGAFGGCFALEEINLSPSLEKIGEYAFSNTYALESIVLPDSVEMVGMNAFMESGVTSVAVPQGKGAWLYAEELPSDDPATEEDEGVLPGSDEAEEYLFNFSFDGSREYKGYLPSFEISDGEKAADYFKGNCLEAFWYFVTPVG